MATQLGELVNLGESPAEIDKESVRGRSISLHRGGPQGEGEGLDMASEDLFEAGAGWVHEIGEAAKRVRFWRARAYSRHTSWGASWT